MERNVRGSMWMYLVAMLSEKVGLASTTVSFGREVTSKGLTSVEGSPCFVAVVFWILDGGGVVSAQEEVGWVGVGMECSLGFEKERACGALNAFKIFEFQKTKLETSFS